MSFFLFLTALAITIYLYKKHKKNTQLKNFINNSLPKQFIVLDLETSGLDPLKHEIIEIGIISVDTSSTQHKTLNTLIKPTKPITKKITQITGITNEQLNLEGVSLDEALAQSLAIIGDRPIVTYNAEFDIAFLESALKAPIQNPKVCALKLARKAFPGLKSYKLSEVCRALKIPHNNAHRALGDARATLDVYLAGTLKLTKN